MFKIICLLLIITFPVSADIHGSFEIGKDLDEDIAVAAIDLSVDIQIWQLVWTIYGGWDTWFFINWESIIGQGPFRDIYEIGTRIQWKFIYIDWNYFCNHAVYSATSAKKWNDLRWGDYRNVVSVGIKW